MLNVSETSAVYTTSLRYHLTELESTLVLYYLDKPEVLNTEIVFLPTFNVSGVSKNIWDPFTK
jgi:hypothetical protein